MASMLPVARHIVAFQEQWNVIQDSIVVEQKSRWAGINFTLACDNGWQADCHISLVACRRDQELEPFKLWHKVILKKLAVDILMNWRQPFLTCPFVFVQCDEAATVDRRRCLLHLHRDSRLAFKWLQISGAASGYAKGKDKRSTTAVHISVDATRTTSS